MRDCVVCVFCVLLCCVCACTAQECSSSNKKSVKFGVTSEKNQTGHWMGHVKLDHAAKKETPGLWEVYVDHTTTDECDGDQVVSLAATVMARPQMVQKQTIQQSPKKLDPSYHLVPGFGYYKLHTTRLSWHTAREMCATEGGHLLILNSVEEWEAVKTMLENSAVASRGIIHLGITDFAKEGQFVTLFGDPVNSTGYHKWTPGSPVLASNKHCGYIGKNGLLGSERCEDTETFFCEAELSI